MPQSVKSKKRSTKIKAKADTPADASQQGAAMDQTTPQPAASTAANAKKQRSARRSPPAPLKQHSFKPPITTAALIRSTSGIAGLVRSGDDDAMDVDKLESMVAEVAEEDRANDEQQLVGDADSGTTSDDEDEYWIAEEILESKVEDGKTHYLIRWDGYDSDEDSWEPESHILDKSLLTRFQNKPVRTLKRQGTKDGEWMPKKGSSATKRPKKKRATGKNKPGDNSSDDQPPPTRSDSSSGGALSKSPKKKERVLKTSVRAAKKAQALQEIQNRIRARSQLVPPVYTGSDVDPLRASELDTSCCMVCSIREYTRAITTGDAALFAKAMAAKTHVCAWTQYPRPDLPFDTPLVHAVHRNDLVIAKQLIETRKYYGRVNPPVRYVDGDSGGTGYLGLRVFSHRMRTVNESRGNREGNTAFFKRVRTEYMEVHNVRERLFNDVVAVSVLEAMRDPSTTPDMIDLLMLTDDIFKECVTKWGVYEAAAAGNRGLAAHLVESMMNGYGFNHLHKEVLKFTSDEKLTDYRRNQILKMATGNHNVNPLELAAVNPDAQYVRVLFENLSPAETATQDELGRTVAHFAVACEGTAPLEYLIEKGVNFATADLTKMTPLILCAKFGRADNLRILIPHLGGADATKVTLLKQGWTALHYAAHYGHAEACRALLDCGAAVDILDKETKATPLMHAAKMGHTEAACVLLEGGADPHAVDKFKRTPLHLAAKNGWFDIVVELLRRGVDASAKDSSDNQPLHYAAAYGWVTLVKLLIEFGGADPNGVNNWKTSPCAIADMKGHMKVVNYLLNNPDVNVNFRDKNGQTMLHTCFGERFDSFYEAERVAAKARLLCSRGGDPNIQDLEGNTVIHVLAKAAFFKCSSSRKPMSPPPPKEGELEPEPERVFSDEDGIVTQLEMARLLILNGADVNQLNTTKKTPLQCAAEADNKDMVAFLIQNGADLSNAVSTTAENVFHFFLKAAAEIEDMQADDEEERARKERLQHKLEVIWETIMKRKSDDASVEVAEAWAALANALNDEGYSPLLLGFVHCMNLLFNNINKKKNEIKTALRPQPYYYNSWNASVQNAAQGPKTVDLRYHWEYWMLCAEKFIKAFAPDMNATKQLPKDFLKNNPKAIIKDHPERTGWGLLHFAGNLQDATIIDFFLTHGCLADLAIDGHDNARTPIMYVVMLGDDEEDYKPDSTPETLKKLDEKFVILKNFKKQGWIDSTRLLLENNADPFLPDEKGETALMFAAEQQNDMALQIILQILIERIGVDAAALGINRANKKKETVLMKAIAQSQAHAQSASASTAPTLTTAPSEAPSASISAIFGSQPLPVALVSTAGLFGQAAPLQAQSQEAFTKQTRSLGGHPKLPAAARHATINKLLEAGGDVNAVDENNESVLIKSIRTKQADLVNLFINVPGHVDLQLRNKSGETALIVACKLNDADIVDSLLAKPGCSGDDVLVNIADDSSSTALFIAAQNANVRIVTALLDKCNADPNSSVHRETGSTPLIEAVKKKNLDVVRLLLKAGANVNVKDARGVWAIHYGTNSQNAHIVEALVDAGASVHSIDKGEHTPLHYAIQNSKSHTNTSLKIERLLLKHGSNVNAADYQGRTPLHIAFVDLHLIPLMNVTRLEKEKVDKQKALLERRKEKEQKLRMFTRKYTNGDENLDQWLLTGKRKEMAEQKDDANMDFDENFSVTYTTGIYRKDFWEKPNSRSGLVKGDPIEIVSFLMALKDIHIDVMDGFGRTPLHYAGRLGAFTCSSYLLDHGAQVNAEDLDRNTPLQIALIYDHVDYSVMLANKNAEVLRDLVRYNGDSLSTFNFSLSKSFMSLSYLIMEKGVSLIGSVSDALCTGKFHLALLLISKAEEFMLQQLNSNGQNLFHVLGDFRPFDKSIWDEYIAETFEILLANGLDYSLVDNFGRTPLHYAAKFGHEILVTLLLGRTVAVNLVDEDGHTPLWYAVMANSTPSFQILLNHLPDVNLGDMEKHPSILFNAVKARNLSMVQTLLEVGARWDADAQNDRQNSVLKAVVDNSYDILQALIKAGADINEASVFTFAKEMCGAKQHQMHPIFLATTSSTREIFELLLSCGANPNIFNVFEDKMMTPLMVSLTKRNYDYVKLLIKREASVNEIDPVTRRTPFYTFLFDKIDSLEENMWSANPNVSFIDEKTRQTPLEYAIRVKDLKLLKLLLDHDADPNVRSCVAPSSGLCNEPVTPLVHAICENNLEAVKLILEHKQAANKLDMGAVNESGQNYIFYAVSTFTTLSFENVNLLRLLVKAMGGDKSKYLEHVDVFGNRAIKYAYQQNSKKMYNALLNLGANPLSQHEMAAIDNVDANMDVDLPEPVDVEADAKIAREAIEEEAKFEEAKKNGDFDENGKPKKKRQVDPNSKLKDIGEVLMEGDEPLDIMLNRTDVDKGYYGENLFYKMQVIHNRVQDLYILFTRWGGVGETGMFQKTPFNSMEEAVEEFKKIFKSKTSNLWEHRFSEEFIPKDGRFVVTKLAEKTKPLALKPLDLSKSPRSKLPHSVQDTLKVFCDIASMNKMVDDEKLDLPLGYLTAATVEEGYQLLMEIRDQIKQMEVKKTTTNGILDVKAIKAIRHKLVQLSNQYYTRIPNKDYIRTGIRPLVDLSNVQKEMQRIDNIRYLNSGANMLLGAELRGKEINPLDYCYRAFQCRMDEVEPETEEYKVVSRYMDTTAKNNDYEIIHLFGLDRAGERARFEPFSDDKNRRLLWHGSRLSNFMGILSQGLRVAPFEAEVTGYMFGKGIYFGDMFCKSINYAQEWRSAAGTQAYSCLLLCEVALGDMYEREHSEYMDHAQPGFLSTKGLGMEGPEDNMSLHVRRDGVIIPQGPPTRCEYKKRLDEDGEEISRVLSFNEYIVYDRTQVKMRYLVLVRDKNYCFLCDKSVGSNSVMPLKEFKFKSLPNGVLAGNEYEKLVVETYLRHEGMTSQELFDGYLEARVLKTEAYRDKWQPVTQLLPTSKVCSGCANDVMNILVYETLTQKKAALPAGVSLRPNCWYGQECRAQGTLKHTMHYNHICRRTKFDDKEEEAAARKRKMRYIVGSDGEDAEDDDGESEDDDEEDEEADEDDEDYDSMAEFIFEDDIER